MKQRGRKSIAELSVITVDGSPDPLQPPDHLSANERQRFTNIVASCDARHFRPSDTTLLCRFVEADALAERAAKELRKHPVIKGKPSPWLTVQEKKRARLDRTGHPVAPVTAKPDRCQGDGPSRATHASQPVGVGSTGGKKAVKHAAGRRSQAEIFRADGAL
jgi:hypothetical protein